MNILGFIFLLSLLSHTVYLAEGSCKHGSSLTKSIKCSNINDFSEIANYLKNFQNKNNEFSLHIERSNLMIPDDAFTDYIMFGIFLKDSILTNISKHAYRQVKTLTVVYILRVNSPKLDFDFLLPVAEKLFSFIIRESNIGFDNDNVLRALNQMKSLSDLKLDLRGLQLKTDTSLLLPNSLDYRLNLRYLKWTNESFKALSHLEKLENLYLNDNGIEDINDNDFKSFLSLKRLDLANNQIKCDCKLKKLTTNFVVDVSCKIENTKITDVDIRKFFNQVCN